jgi:hypothetical protein
LSATIVASWQFDNDLTDSSGNGYNLTEVGPAPSPFSYAASSTGMGASISMDAQVDNYLVEADSDILANVPYTATVTFDAMVRFRDGLDVDSAILANERVNNTQVWWRMEDSGYQRFYWRVYKDENDPAAGGAAIIALGTTLINDGQWHRLTAIKSFDPSGAEGAGALKVDLYVDGNLDGTMSDGRWLTSFDQGVGDMYVGTMVDDGKDMVGDIDYLTIKIGPDPAILPLETYTMFEQGANGYHTFRIPALLSVPDGPLLAFCEGRVWSRWDRGDIDIVLKRSFDGGKTWGSLQLIWSKDEETCGNPTAVYDSDTGRIWLLMSNNNGLFSTNLSA